MDTTIIDNSFVFLLGGIALSKKDFEELFLNGEKIEHYLDNEFNPRESSEQEWAFKKARAEAIKEFLDEISDR